MPSAATIARETLTGFVERVTFHHPETGFAVLQVQIAGRRDCVTVVGTVTTVTPGESLSSTGTWVIDRQYGRQWRAQTLALIPPNTPEGMTKYLVPALRKASGRCTHIAWSKPLARTSLR